MKTVISAILLSVIFTARADYAFSFQPFPGVDSLKTVECSKDRFKFQVTDSHSFIMLRTKAPVELAGNEEFSFFFEAPLPGRITFFYYSADGTLVNMETPVPTLPGRNEYAIDLSKVPCGKQYRSKAIPGYQQFGAAEKKITGLRVDFWFPKGTVLTFESPRLGKPESDVVSERK